MSIPIFDSQSSGSSGEATGTSQNVTHTGAGSNVMAIAAIATNGAIGSPAVTYDGSPMTLRQSFTAGLRDLHIFILNNVSLGSVTVAFSWTNSVKYIVACKTYSGVDPNNPFGDEDSLEGSGASSSLTLTSAAQELVIDVMQHENGADAEVVGAGQTQRWDISSSGRGLDSSEEPGAGTVTMSWTHPNVEKAHWAIALKPGADARTRSVKYLHNTFSSRLAGMPIVLDVLGRQVPIEQVEFDNWMRTDGPFFPTSRKFSSTIEDPNTAYIESLRISRGKVTIETAKESQMESLFRRLTRSS